MPQEITSLIDQESFEKLKNRLDQGDYRGVEQEVMGMKKKEAEVILASLLSEYTQSPQGRQRAKALCQKHRYVDMHPKEVEVAVLGGGHITVKSWYARQAGHKKGPKKKGRNGRGKHLLLSYWGYSNKRSPGSMDEVVRCGVASQSYDLAKEELSARAVCISADSIKYSVEHVGAIANQHRGTISLHPQETLAGKRVMLSLDGGRIRSRELKIGRPKKGAKLTGFETPWREPKLLVIAEMDERGHKKKGTKPLYEATMGSPDEIFTILKELCFQLHLEQASEIACLGDGASWVWGLFEKLIEQLGIQEKTTEIVDFYHAIEHINEMSEAHIKKTAEEQHQWAQVLQKHLREGKFDLFEQLVFAEAKKHNLPDLLKRFKYFQSHKQWMHYDEYEAKNLPIGSGIVESAIKRVINQRIKSPGSFWKKENAEKMLQLRCILMAGRWKPFMDNFIQSVRLTLD